MELITWDQLQRVSLRQLRQLCVDSHVNLQDVRTTCHGSVCERFLQAQSYYHSITGQPLAVLPELPPQPMPAKRMKYPVA